MIAQSLHEHASPLSAEQEQRFLSDGFLVIPDLIPNDVVAAVSERIRRHLGDLPDHPDCWDENAGCMLKHPDVGEACAQKLTARYCGILDQLCGADRYGAPHGLGYLPIRFATPDVPTWRAFGMHIDGAHFHHHLTSSEQGLVAVEMWTDILPEGGGTAIHVGSHRLVAAILAAAEPDGMAIGDLSSAAITRTGHLPVQEIYGGSGSVLFMHPHLLHGSSTNRRAGSVRIAGNQCISLKNPMSFERETITDYSLVELATRHALMHSD